jgi:hypothetical protein
MKQVSWFKIQVINSFLTASKIEPVRFLIGFFYKFSTLVLGSYLNNCTNTYPLPTAQRIQPIRITLLFSLGYLFGCQIQSHLKA